MAFRENLLKKIQINRLTDMALRSLGPPDSGRRLDRETVRNLLGMGPYQHRKERDLDLYLLNENEILVLDNELKIYHTTAEDIAIRKSPTVKEMISIRNAIKILNDKDVVSSSKSETLERVRSDLIQALDLTFASADIESLAKDGVMALENAYSEGVIETLALFAELLGYQTAPRIFQIPHHRIWGTLKQSGTGELHFGPLVMYGLMGNTLKMIHKPVSSLDKDGLQRIEQTAKGEANHDPSGSRVWEELKKAVLAQAPPAV